MTGQSLVKESLVRSLLNKRSNVPTTFHAVYDKSDIPFPVCELANVGQQELIHYSLHNWSSAVDALCTPTVCVHGLNGSRLLFADLAQVVEAQYPALPLVLIDLHGHGLSSCPKRKYNPEFFVAQIEKLLAHLGMGRDRMVNLVGFSLGGAVSVAFARKHSARIEKLVLISPAGFVPFSGPPSKSASSEELYGVSSHVKLVKWIPSFILSPVMRSMFKSALKHPQPELPDTAPQELRAEHQLQMDRLVWQSFVKKGTVEATISIVKHFPLFDMAKEYAAVASTRVGSEVPVLIIWGEQDRVNPLSRCGDRVKSFFKNSFLLKVEDAAHVVIGEQPQIVVSSIVSFLQSAPEFKFFS